MIVADCFICKTSRNLSQATEATLKDTASTIGEEVQTEPALGG